MNAFAQALQAKAHAAQAKMFANSKTSQDDGDHILTPSELKEAVAKNYPEPDTIASIETESRAIIDVVVNRNRLDIFFPAKPSEEMLGRLHIAGWHYRPSDKAWYHQDNRFNREWCNMHLQADLDLPVEDSTEEPSEEKPDRLFEEFRRMVDELCEHYQCDKADIAMRAVRELYNTIS